MMLARPSSRAQTFGDLNIRTAIEIEFATESGKVYQLERSSNLVDWSAVEQPQCGTGLPVARLFSARPGGDLDSKFYRLQVITTNCPTPQSRGLLVLGEAEALTVATNLLGVGGLYPRQNTIPAPDEAVLFTVSVKNGPMPQTADQIMAIQGRQHGPAAIFLVDNFPAPDLELRDLVLLETRDLLKKYHQPGVDALPVLYDDHADILGQIRDLIAEGPPP